MLCSLVTPKNYLGSFLNLIIYTLLNDNMKRSIRYAVRFTAFKCCDAEDPRPSAGNYSLSTKTTDLNRPRKMAARKLNSTT